LNAFNAKGERGRRNIKREWNEEETEIKGKRT